MKEIFQSEFGTPSVIRKPLSAPSLCSSYLYIYSYSILIFHHFRYVTHPHYQHFRGQEGH